MTGQMQNIKSKCGSCISFLILTVCWLLFAPSVSALEVSSKRECAVCHVMWLDDFKTEEETLIPWVGTNVLMKTTYGVVSSEDVCYSCHDGYILDSRWVWTGEKHTVYKKPKDVKFDEKKFPLSVKDEIYCGTCHTIHAGPSEEIISYKVFLRMDNRNSEMCRACHKEYDEGPKKGYHTILKEVKEGFPDELKEMGLRPAINKKDIICDSCHRVHGAKQENLLPVEAGISDFCGKCHKEQNVKRAGEGNLLAHKMDREIKKAKPSDVLKKEGAKFENDRLMCLSCHKVHKGKTESILVMDNRDSGLCYECHEDQKVIKDTPHNIRATDKEMKIKTVKKKTAEEVGTCGICHNSHGWAQEVKKGEPAASEVCNVCHGTNRNVSKVEIKGPYIHTIGKGLEEIDPKLKIDLPFFNERFLEGDKVYCATCHEPHKPPEKTKDERGMIKTKFLRDADKTALCGKCHKDEKLVEGTDHDPSTFEKGYKNIRGEDSKTSGICGACHMVHEGPKPIGFAVSPLERDYPEEVRKHRENIYCLSCHERKRVGEEKLIGEISHPLGKKPKEGESEDKRKDEEVTCKSCHSPHIWSPTLKRPGIGKNVEGDITNSFLKMDNSRGDLCKECHKTPYKVAKTKHDMSEEKKRGKEKGVCEQCHTSHNAKEINLWARDISKFRPEEKVKFRLCLECHREGETGEKAPVKFYRHPEDFLLANRFLLTEKEEKKATGAEVTCLTCHTPHVWSKAMIKGEPGKTTTSLTAFLKVEDVAKTFCVDCHREDARYRFQFYHTEKPRIKDSPYYDPLKLLELLQRKKR